jgi:uncharacterized protein (DUF736 family)
VGLAGSVFPIPTSQEATVQQIGSFTRDTSGYSGRVHTLTLDFDAAIVAAEPNDAENAPDFRVHLGDADGPEIGAGWKRTGEKAGEYVSLLIDDPTFVQPLRANLFRDDDKGAAWSLHWSRPTKREGRD